MLICNNYNHRDQQVATDFLLKDIHGISFKLTNMHFPNYTLDNDLKICRFVIIFTFNEVHIVDNNQLQYDW